jgi:hypothetical protein
MRIFHFFKHPAMLIPAFILLYLITHLLRLTLLPLFADEAIYIRWAQLAISDWSRYALFPLNDGKTPLFIWMLVPLIQNFFDPLWAGRLLSVVAGLFQLILTIMILKTFKVRTAGQITGAIITICAPFWFFHHRMVLMDGWMTVWLSLATLALTQVSMRKRWNSQKVIWGIVGIVSVWAGLMTKVPFILALPVLALVPLALKNDKIPMKIRLMEVVSLLIVGSLLFFTLSFSPIFPQLLSRGSDFLFPVSEVLAGRWRETLPSIPTYIGYFVSYTGWGAVLFALIAVFQPGKRRAAWYFAAAFFLYSLPIWILGRVVFPRYLFPAMLYVTLLASVGGDTLWHWSEQHIHTQRRKGAIRWLYFMLMLQLVITGVGFMLPSWTNADQIPFVPSDQSQYQSTWSSGHGLRETYALLQELDSAPGSGAVVVATEGNFGSLPDGLLLMNFRHPLKHTWIEGIGYPVESIPIAFAERITPEDKVLLVVNSDRLQWPLDRKNLLQEFCRPHNGPCLQVWNITESYSQFKKN